MISIVISSYLLSILENVERIAQPDYVPSADDIMHIRIGTIGMVEHVMNVGSMRWRVCDPAGIKGQRKHWLPYFDDASAVIFVCAISSFNQALKEDGETNRMEDALRLFESIAQNKLLAKVDLIIFLNKCDILSKKLKQGNVRLSTYFPDFEGKNDVRNVTGYFAERFSASNVAFPNRQVYVHPTTAISRSAMRATTR
ncbi:hypothetical protein CROQUDRAFT_35902 [Cronartium quercuum f. sp. fusiforme G11]|uniref:Uncharacterized protein n=1 Tax=Cronartium quercuum f. sp. fusiforme G11 TaxID=708437 RepID=A0A9P6NR77_9BASI|nr:hypothetical protein CROQUDRAFT_35902 [Cronartium quercuum f. sp. fusiforme G11]